jgi:hypothetical protein
MAHPETTLPDKVLDAIARQVGERLVDLFPSSDLSSAKIELEQTFPLWMLEADRVKDPSADLAQAARSTGRWHHQVTFDGKAQAFARSVSTGSTPDGWSVRDVWKSPLAQQIDDRMNWIDQHVFNDPAVRLLTVPAYQVDAFWLISGPTHGVVVIRVPAVFGLGIDQLYPAATFLRLLAQHQPVTGIRT